MKRSDLWPKCDGTPCFRYLVLCQQTDVTGLRIKLWLFTNSVAYMRCIIGPCLTLIDDAFPIVVIFFRGCLSEMVELSYFVIYYIYILGTHGPCFHYWCSVYVICKWSDTLVVLVCLQITPYHYHRYADLSEGIKLLKCLSGICYRVCV